MRGRREREGGESERVSESRAEEGGRGDEGMSCSMKRTCAGEGGGVKG